MRFKKLEVKLPNITWLLLQLGRAIVQRLEGRKQIVIIWLVILVSTFFFTSSAVSLTTARLEYKNAISIFNLGDSDLIFQQNDKILNLPTFASHYEITNNLEKFTISKTDITREIKEFTVAEKKSKLYLYVASEDNRYCYISADVTSLYYDNGDDTNLPQAIFTVRADPSPILEIDLDWNRYDYVFPGRYFPSEINDNSNGKRLMGIYPIECKSINDLRAISDIITFYKTFRAEVERELLQNEIKKLQ